MADLSPIPTFRRPQPTAFVYVIGARVGPKKIGFTNDMARRLQGLQTGNPLPLVVSYSREAPKADAVEVERRTHLRLKDRSMRGEWFAVTAAEAAEAVEAVFAELAAGHLVAKASANPRAHRRRRDSIQALASAGALTPAQHAAALWYRDLWESVSAHDETRAGWSQRLDDAGRQETMLADRQELVALNAVIGQATSAETVAVMSGVIGKGHSLRQFAISGSRYTAVSTKLKAALDLVSEHLARSKAA